MSSEVMAPNSLTKQPSEVRSYTMDFSNLMITGETITSIVSVTSSRIGGDGASELIITDKVIDGQTITMTIASGLNRQKYITEVIIMTSAGQTLEGDGMLQVKDR